MSSGSSASSDPSGQPANAGGRNEFIFKAANQLVNELAHLDKKAREVTQSIIDNRSIKDRNVAQFQRLRAEAVARVTQAGIPTGDARIPFALNLARRASDVFKDPDHLKAAKASHDFVASIGGIDKIEEYKKKSEAIKDRKVDDVLLNYDEVLSKYKMNTGSVIMMVWSCGSKSFVRVEDQFSDSKSSTSICVRLLVSAKNNKAVYTTVHINIINQYCIVVTGANLQKLFDEVCNADNIKKLYALHLENCPARYRYDEHDFARAVVQKSRDGIEESPGLTKILAPCGNADSSMSKKQGKMPMDASCLKKLADAASKAMAADESDDEPVFLAQRSRDERDRQGRLEAICLE
jgi:hypothetical protein